MVTEHNYKHCVTSAGNWICSYNPALPLGFCATALCDASMLVYHCKNCEGYQSESLMIHKVQQLVSKDVQKLPKAWDARHAQPRIQFKWVHALQTVLYVFRSEELWLCTKLYGMDDLFIYLDAVDRAKVALSHLIKDKFFDSPALSVARTRTAYAGAVLSMHRKSA